MKSGCDCIELVPFPYILSSYFQGVFMKKTQAVNLTQKIFCFKKDNAIEHEGFTFYKWKARELCKVLGVMELDEGQPNMILGVGRELFDFAEVPLDEFESVVDTTRDFSTTLATADRPQGVVVTLKV